MIYYMEIDVSFRFLLRQVIGVPFYKTSSENDISIASWKFNKRDINSQDALEIINEAYGNLPFRSTIVEETRLADEYHAVLSVHDQLKQVTFFISISYPTKVPVQFNNRSLRKRCKIFWRCSGVFIVNFGHISHFFLVFLLLTLNR